jgi:hypothetical protein
VPVRPVPDTWNMECSRQRHTVSTVFGPFSWIEVVHRRKTDAIEYFQENEIPDAVFSPNAIGEEGVEGGLRCRRLKKRRPAQKVGLDHVAFEESATATISASR